MIQISQTRPLRSPLWLMFALALVTIAAVACGTDNGDDGGSGGVGSSSKTGFAKIAEPEQTYNFKQISDAGFKKSKTYDVTDLDGATEAYYGFFGSDPYNRQEFEIRFYPSHQVALDTGVPFADESTGEDAVILEEVQRWDVGLSERRQCAGNGGHAAGKCDNAKYGDYVIRGNMILMCQGKDSIGALKNCEDLLKAVAVAARAA